MPTPEDTLRRLWLAWQRGTPSPNDSEWNADYEAFLEVLESVHGGASRACTHQDVADFLVDSRPTMWANLLQEPNAQTRNDEFALYRGLSDEVAQDAQISLEFDMSFTVLDDRPLSYSTRSNAALGFARKGHVPGFAYSTWVRSSDIVFVDCWGFSHANLLDEREVIVWHHCPMLLGTDDVVQQVVDVGKTTAMSRTASRMREQRALELQSRFARLHAERSGT
jgi:hypothetical protein